MADDLDDILEVGRGQRQATDSAASGVTRDFPALQIIAGIHKVIAVVAFVLGVIGVMVVLAAPRLNALELVILVASTLIVPLFLWGSGELILAFLRIERNTRRASELLSAGDRRGSLAEPSAAPDRRGM